MPFDLRFADIKLVDEALKKADADMNAGAPNIGGDGNFQDIRRFLLALYLNQQDIKRRLGMVVIERNPMD